VDQTIINKPMLGTGFAPSPDAWRAQNYSGPADVKSGGLTYSKGGQDLLVSGDQQVDQYDINDHLRARLASPVSTGTVYMSALAMAPGTNSGGTWGPYISANQANVDVTVFIPHDDLTHLAVIKFDLGVAGKGDDTATTWIDPTPGSAEGTNTPLNAGIDLSGDGQWSGTLESFVVRGGRDISFDEIRFGDTFEDVTPADVPEGEIPEPCTLVLAAMGLMGIGRYARRRRPAAA